VRQLVTIVQIINEINNKKAKTMSHGVATADNIAALQSFDHGLCNLIIVSIPRVQNAADYVPQNFFFTRPGSSNAE
jgi:hypothetical protein